MSLTQFAGTAVQASIRSNPNFSPATPLEVLRELFDLLENYGPTWYTEELHHRAVAALRDSVLT